MKGGLPHLQESQNIQYLAHLQDLLRIQSQLKHLKFLMFFIKSTHNEVDSSIIKPTSEFEPPKEKGEQITINENKLLTTNLTVEIQS